MLHEGAKDKDLAALYTEIEVLLPLRHPNVIQILGVSNDPPGFMMERAPHGSLDRLISAVLGRKMDIPFECCVDYIHQVAAGMHYLHSKNVLHRDLKTPNILIFDSMKMKLTDFGLARVKQYTYTRTAAMGTITHTAPETFGGIFSNKSDVYSFSMLCWVSRGMVLFCLS